ncbi:endonuclease/exonuclease/phosphatase family protein [Aliiglaciecola sp. CAU 1673]|uniref:endonuclease/exonuclease/phosphatase family protein n=1 Tax=Aliiglaciecola sp. CAU 1673 TaxID=3032595 RepID=UPI0023D9EA9B|nr:endonuclease/exonuclease/phosphatase family protein [Aliiglaciecola sp. CAU 1673]MDF2176765.1 endonuclease/exonuclease/phosphatase family protein [Aliiglaciecola sp. CAU 1673]
MTLTLVSSFYGQAAAEKAELRIATFNVSMEATNYVDRESKATGNELFERLADGQHPQIRNTAEIIQRVRPDIVLLNEFDYHADPQKGVLAFVKNYLQHSQNNAEPIDYPYFYIAPVNTGVDSGVDLSGDGIASGTGDDAFGYGVYPGQYGMVLLSRYPIDKENVRTFQYFLWKDMPGNLMQTVVHQDGRPWYGEQARQVMRLSSKSHWDIPVKVNGKTIHVLASHPTPPVFDGPEDRNGKRNHDEVRFWVDYLSAGEQAAYLYDDKGQRGGISGETFVIVGDLNSNPVEGNAHKEAISALIGHEKVAGDFIPTSEGGELHSPDNPRGKSHTAGWRMRADYVLPSKAGWDIHSGGVFWPKEGEELYRLVKDRQSSSDHRLVWMDLQFQ